MAGAATEKNLELALRALSMDEEGGGKEVLLEALARAACDYRLWTRKLLTVRMVQTLTVLDGSQGEIALEIMLN